MARRFSDRELFELRNNISISLVIEKILNLPSKEVDGVYKFLCPTCQRHSAAVNPRTNLSRCFSCQQNFNTIELIMRERKVNFVEAVLTLKKFLDNTRNIRKAQSNQNTQPISQNQPTSLGDLLRMLS